MKESQEKKEQEEELDLTEDSLPESKKSFTDLIDKILTKGMLPKDAMGLNNQVLEGIYAQAYRLYNTGKYGEAIHLFRMLILLNSKESKYALGLAACFHMLKEYQNAAQTYIMCSVLDPHSPIPYYHSSDCFIQMKDEISAMLCLELAIQKAQDKPEFAKLRERALLSLESIQKQQQSSGANLSG